MKEPDSTEAIQTTRVVPIEEGKLLKIAVHPGISVAIEDVLKEYSCTIERGDETFFVIFPEGTVREEILPRLPMSERYILHLPDGYTVWQTWMRYHAKSLLYCE